MTTNLAVVDSNILIALVDRQDKWHLHATELLGKLNTSQINIVYFDCVLNETISVLARRSEEQKRFEQFPDLLDQLSKQVPEGLITWISGETKRLYREILELIRTTNAALNFNDALIALVCRELEIKTLVSFDKDFDNIGWLSRVAQIEDN